MSKKNREIKGLKSELMQLLHAIQQADLKNYGERVAESVTCFEPETKGHLLRGIDLHALLVEKATAVEHYHIELIDPVIKVKGSMAFVAYTLHLTEIHDEGEAISCENVTRIFEKEDGKWKMVHFHRS